MSPSPWRAADAAAAQLLAPADADATAAVTRLSERLGAAPPFVVRVDEAARSPAAFDEAGALHLHPSLGGSDAPIPLLNALVEAAGRWALTVRWGLAPQRLAQLEAERAWPWGALGVWLAQWGGVAPAGLAPVVVQGDVLPIGRWGRGGYRVWRALAQEVGPTRALTEAEALLRAPEGDAPPRLLTLLGLSGDAGIPLAARLFEALEGEPELALHGMGARDLQVGGQAGAGALIPVDLSPSPAGPTQLDGALSFALLRPEGGGWRRVTGPLPGGGTLLLVTSADGPWRVHREASPLLGTWLVRGADYGGRVFGARGLGVRFEADGRLELELGDAFVGPVTPSGLSMAQEVGISGAGRGRWAMEEGLLHLRELETGHLTMHSRAAGPTVAFPSSQAEESALFFARSIESVRWEIDEGDGALTLRSRFFGVPASLRLSREGVDEDLPLAEA